MIKTFVCDETAALFHGWFRRLRKIPETVWSVSARKLDMLNSTSELRDLLSPPGNRLVRTSHRFGLIDEKCALAASPGGQSFALLF